MSNSLTKLFLLARLGKGTKGDIWVLALWYQASCDQSNDVEVLPIISFGRHGGHKYTI